MQYAELIRNLVGRELKGRYKGSALGFLWSILTPLFMALVYMFFLRLMAGRGVPMEEIIIGVFAWQFTATCVNDGLMSISGNANLVKKVFFPRILLPISSTLANLVNYLLSLVVQFALVAMLLQTQGRSMSIMVALVPALIFYHTAFNLALALCVSSMNVYFRDLQHIIGVLLSAWFFASPAMYNLSFIEGVSDTMPWLMDYYMLNPAAIIFTGYRALILPEVVFPWSTFTIIGMVWPLALLFFSVILFKRLQKNFADML